MIAAATLLAAVLIQVATNFANDYYDFFHGADREDRLGPTRVTQAGLIQPGTVRNAAFASLLLAAVLGLVLIREGGWPIAVIGIAGLVCAVAYTGGPYPLAYHGLGDLFVFIFFGVIAVCGTFYLQTGTVSLHAALASAAVGSLATAILVVNNLRDIATDERSGKNTMAVRIGESGTRRQYAGLLVASVALSAALATSVGGGVWLALAAAPVAAREIMNLASREGEALNNSLAGTARLHLLYGVLLCAGLLI